MDDSAYTKGDLVEIPWLGTWRVVSVLYSAFALEYQYEVEETSSKQRTWIWQHKIVGRSGAQKPVEVTTEPHIMGLSREEIDQEAYRVFMQAL